MGLEANGGEQTPTEAMQENVEELLEAARYDDIDDLVRLASTGISLDSKDSQGRTVTALQDVLDQQDIEVAPFSYSQAGMNIQDSCSNGFVTALHMAAANGHLDIVEYLIGSGADVNASNAEKNTPLHWACLNGHVEVAKKLVVSGANVSLLNSHERTPIDEAVSMGKMDVIDAVNATIAELELSGVSVS